MVSQIASALYQLITSTLLALKLEKYGYIVVPSKNFYRASETRFYRASYASTVLVVIVCLSVRLSVCPSQVGVVQ